MATIAGPRPTRHYAVGALVDVTNSRVHTSLKCSPRRYSMQRGNKPPRSLRDSYTEAFMKAAQVQQTSVGPSQLVDLHDPENMIDSQSCMDPSGDQNPPSHPCPAASEISIIDTKDSPGRQGLRLTESQLDIVPTPATPLRTLFDKPLPPNPALHSQDIPEWQDIFEASVLTEVPRVGPFPSLEPASTIEAAGSYQLSPGSSSFHLTPSLMARNQSPNSVSTGVIERGVADVTTIQSITGYQRVSKTVHFGDASSRKYILNISGSSRIPRRNSMLNSGQKNCGSPSRKLSSGNKVNCSMQHERQVTNSFTENFEASKQGNVLSALPLTAAASDKSLERTLPKDVLEKCFTDEGTLRTSSRYGYNIRESFEAREAIMGLPGHSDSRNRVGRLLKSRSDSAATNQTTPVREYNIELATPNAKSESKNANKQHVVAYPRLPRFDKAAQEIDRVLEGQEDAPRTPLRTGHPAFGRRFIPRKSHHPPRTSSLPSTPSSQQPSGLDSTDGIKLGSESHTAPVLNAHVEEVSSDSSKPIPPTSRLSLFYRSTTASAAREAFNAKKISEPRSSISRIPQSRTLGSLSDVRKGVKSLGKKVSKIIPGRRNLEVEATVDELPTINGANMHGPRRQASRLLTTYKNSGMNDKLSEDIHNFIPTGDTFIELEPVDRHEPEGADKQKWIWHKGSRNIAHNAEAGRFTPFDQGTGNGYDEDEDEDRPPHQRGVLSAPAHYVDTDESDEPEDSNAISIGNDEVDAFRHINQDDDVDGQLPPVWNSSFIGTGAATEDINQPIPSDVENRFDSLIAETDNRARQLLAYAMSLQQSRHRSLLIESATHLGEGVVHIRQARIESVRLGQLLEETAVLLASNTHLLSLAIQQSSVTSHAP